MGSLAMNVHFSDTVHFLGREFAVAGCDGLGLFEPCMHGLRPVMTSSRCCRGYRCRYAVAAERLILDEVAIGLDGRDAEDARHGLGPSLLGRVPCPDDSCEDEDDHDGAFYRYERLAQPVVFSGRLLVGSGLTPGGSGLPAACRFRNLLELIFESGRLVQVVDHSARIARVHARHIRVAAAPDDLFELLGWIERAVALASPRWS